ncbi:hypothetical protein BD413DRAFT_616634 [Trametes elegans]|nr:hypothetical protein BD413DRAFT_616634 [Trametes elegans]
MSANATKVGLEYCQDSAPREHMPPPGCEDYHSFTHISWNWLVNLSDIKQKQRLLEGWDFTDAWLGRELDIAGHDVFYLKDSARNEYAFQDFSYYIPPSRKFLQTIHIASLAERPERLIQLGTLFGSSRLHLRSPANYALRKHVRERMAFTNPHLVRAADAIRTALGGAYLGAHLRVGDGVFEWNAPENMRRAWWKLLLALGLPKNELLALEDALFPEDAELAPPELTPDAPAERTPHPPLPPFPPNAAPAPKLACRAPLHRAPALVRLNAPLFISTDAGAAEPLLARFTRTFPCTFFLADFGREEEAAGLGALRGAADGVPLARFVRPFLDAMVVGHAWAVVGTERSTFSAFVQDVLWRTYHGFEIVQRG